TPSTLNLFCTTVFHPLSLHDALPVLFISCIRTTGFKTISFTHTIIFPGGFHLFLIRTHLAVGGFLRTSFFKRRILFLDRDGRVRSEEHMSELQSRENLVCRLLLE